MSLIELINAYWAQIAFLCSGLVSLGASIAVAKQVFSNSSKRIEQNSDRISTIEERISTEIAEIKAENKADFDKMDGKMDKIMDHLLRGAR